MNDNFCIILPAYKPGEGLVHLVKDIKENIASPVIIIDDGSGPDFKYIFQQLTGIRDCFIISYPVNQGKGHALKKGFKLFLEKFRDREDINGVVTADADGQHLLKDIVNVGRNLADNSDSIILGVRRFKKDVPLRSKLGNNITMFVYRLASGRGVSDTQTGLRGIPTEYIDEMLKLEGNRYEYEMNMLLALKDMDMGVKEVEIDTVYIDDNKGSHFNTVKDSFRIYKMIIKKTYVVKYIISSVLCFIIEYIICISLLQIGKSSGWVWGSNVDNTLIPARIISSVINFLLNKKFVFENKKDKSAGNYLKQSIMYYMLVFFNLFIILRPITQLLLYIGISEYVVTIIAGVLQFSISYFIQKFIIFRKAKKPTSKTSDFL